LVNISRHGASEAGRKGGRLRRLLVGPCAGALRRVAANAWPLLQSTAAAPAAWWLARWLDNHPNPFFAPIAAVVALNASRGERGANALRLLAGVFVGIVAGELAISALGGGYGTLALATFTAMAVAFALGGPRVTIAQAASSAILTVAVADGQAGPNRLVDALIGAGVALVFTQVLFSPEPVALLRRAEAAALAEMADGLELTARALERGDDELDRQAMSKLWDLRDRLVDLRRTRHASNRVVRHSLLWRARMAPVARESEDAGHLDLLGGSCLLLTRTALAMSRPEGRGLAPGIRELAVAIGDLATAPGDRATRQQAADRALALARPVAASPSRSQATLTASAAIRMVATDIAAFAGADPGQAADVVRDGTGDLDVPEPPSAPRVPFRTDRRRRPTR
jgi:uncharacterized membrane protein YgaE (UPF0421/DUF939 family)